MSDMNNINTSIILLATGVAILWSVAAILQKKILKHMSCETLLFFIGAFFGIMSIGFGMAFRGKIMKDLGTGEITSQIWAFLVMMVFLGYVLANYIYFQLMDKHSCYVVVGMTYTTPLFVALFSYFLLNEPFTVKSVAGLVLIVGGILCLGQTS